MNEFTKEELKVIYLNLCINEKTNELVGKIARMIENYCYHIPILKLNHEGVDIFVCKNCNKVC